MRITDIAFAGIYLLVLAVAATQISELSNASAEVVSSHLYPWVVIGTGLAMGGLETLRTAVAGSQAGDPSFTKVWEAAFASRRTQLLLLFILYLAAISFVGFVASTSVFSFVAIMILSPTRTWRGAAIAVAVTAGVIALIYFLLVVYLQSFLP
jgi:hypothetical protein